MKDKAGKQLRWLINAVLLTISLAIAFGLSEFVLRQFFADRLNIGNDERNLLYRYDPRLGWFPNANIYKTLTGKQTITVQHNSRGFRDVEHRQSTKPGLLFLGDSFVWGYDVQAAERFTDKLRVRVPDWEVYNLGVSGYGTDQELLLLMDQFDFYQPKIVFLLFCTLNDEKDNATNFVYRGYYKPYYEVSDQTMMFRGIPVPKSLTYYVLEYPLLAKSYLFRLIIKAVSPPVVRFPHPTGHLIRKMHEYVGQKGSKLVVGLQQPHPIMEAFLQEMKIPYVVLDVETSPLYSEHWTPAGHTAVSNKIFDFMNDARFLNLATTGRQ